MGRAYEQGHPDQPSEECFLCHEYTGRAGAGEDSMYTDSGNHGPFCGDCWSAIGEDLNNAEAQTDAAEELPERAELMHEIDGLVFPVASEIFARIQAFQYVDALTENPPKPTQPNENIGIYAKTCAEEFVAAWIAGTLKTG